MHSPTIEYALKNAPARVQDHIGAADVVLDRCGADLDPVLDAIIADCGIEKEDAANLRLEVKLTLKQILETIEHTGAMALIADEENAPRSRALEPGEYRLSASIAPPFLWAAE